jgi:uncharacterized membrane protein YvbJ
MYCSKCGEEIGNEALFCSNCGNKIITDQKDELGIELKKDLQKLKRKNNNKHPFLTFFTVFIGGFVVILIFIVCMVIESPAPTPQKNWDQLTTEEKNRVYNDAYKIMINSKANSQHPTLFPKNYVGY